MRGPPATGPEVQSRRQALIRDLLTAQIDRSLRFRECERPVMRMTVLSRGAAALGCPRGTLKGENLANLLRLMAIIGNLFEEDGVWCRGSSGLETQ